MDEITVLAPSVGGDIVLRNEDVRSQSLAEFAPTVFPGYSSGRYEIRIGSLELDDPPYSTLYRLDDLFDKFSFSDQSFCSGKGPCFRAEPKTSTYLSKMAAAFFMLRDVDLGEPAFSNPSPGFGTPRSKVVAFNIWALEQTVLQLASKVRKSSRPVEFGNSRVEQLQWIRRHWIETLEIRRRMKFGSLKVNSRDGAFVAALFRTAERIAEREIFERMSIVDQKTGFTSPLFSRINDFPRMGKILRLPPSEDAIAIDWDMLGGLISKPPMFSSEPDLKKLPYVFTLWTTVPPRYLPELFRLRKWAINRFAEIKDPRRQVEIMFQVAYVLLLRCNVYDANSYFYPADWSETAKKVIEDIDPSNHEKTDQWLNSLSFEGHLLWARLFDSFNNPRLRSGLHLLANSVESNQT